MSIKNWNAGIVRPVAVAPTGPYQNGAAPGMWTLDQQAYWAKQGLWPTAGSQDPANIFIENLFSTYLYTGNNSTQTINNGINLSGKGGMIWFKPRSTATSHVVFDTVRGPTKFVVPNSGGFGEITNTVGNDLTSFNSNGFSLGPSQTSSVNVSGTSQVAWTFREQAKFFDVVTYTGNGVVGRTVPHNLGSVPGCIIIKTLNSTSGWIVYHRSLGNDKALFLNETTSQATSSAYWNATTPTATEFTVGGVSANNESGFTYVAYLYAHDAGGFGVSGNENVISCGSFTTDGSGYANVNIGYEPQWILYKMSSASGGGWAMVDTMRGMTTYYGLDNQLFANTSAAEAQNYELAPTATGFTSTPPTGNALYASQTYIYIAIRRGPMAVPTLGTTVFSPNTATYSTNQVVTTGFPVDLALMSGRTVAVTTAVMDRLRGLASNNVSPINPTLFTDTTAIERTDLGYINTVGNTGYQVSGSYSGFSSVNWNFRRAPGFMDVVCYTGTGAVQNISHNLGVVPELIIAKGRTVTNNWPVYNSASGATSFTYLNSSQAAFSSSAFWNNTTPTSSVFTVGVNNPINAAASSNVAYLFATCAGVSKVGNYTGTGTTQAIACGFTTGARYVLIKRMDSTGDWYVWDSARGIVAGNDPYLLLNSAAAEVTGTDYIDTSAAGFEISSTAPAEINAVGGSYIFLAIS